MANDLAILGFRNICKHSDDSPGGLFQNTYELIKLWALKSLPVSNLHILQDIGKIFCVEFQSVPLKFDTKYLTQTLKDTIFIQFWKFWKSSQIYELICIFETPGRIYMYCT